MRILLLMVVILAVMSVYQSYVFLVYQYAMGKMSWALQTVELDFLAQRDSNIECHMHKEVKM
jgi:hypothetical protein